MANRANRNSDQTPKQLLRHGYRYIELIGEGSNGKTYLSKSLKTGETVAIKALKFSDSLKNYELFKREAETLKSIHTPGTPRFYDYITGEGEFTECWLVQEYIEGESLLDKLEKGEKFDEIQSLELIFETAKIVHTLQTSYAPPIIHRDIKPSNILVREAPEYDANLCLIDFGAVANPQKRGLNSTVAGTVGYMAPEQLIGDCTIQSDYYALGATALHMMTGINPSEFPSDGFTIQFEEKLKECVPNVHKETIDLLRKLLASDVNDRPKDAKELLKAISQVLILVTSETIPKRKKQKRKKLNIKNRLANSVSLYVICSLMPVISFLTAFGSVLFFKYGAPILGTCVFIISIFSFAFFSLRMQSNMEHNSKPHNAPTLLNNNTEEAIIQKYTLVAEAKIQKYTLVAEETPDLSDSKEATGEIVRLVDDIIEYVVNIGHKYYTAFYKNNESQIYEVGDKIRVKYVKKFGKYRFYEVKPE